MAIPELELKRVENLLTQYCEKKVPPHVRHQVELLFRRRGHTVTLHERRPDFLDNSQYTELSVAKFVYDPEQKLWSLKYADRNERWHLYDECIGVRDFKTLLDEVDADPTGIFWG